MKKIIIFCLITFSLIIGYYIFNINNEEEVIVSTNTTENNKETNNSKEVEEIVVHVAGAVNKPGVIKLEVKSRIMDAIEKAGGLKEEADITNINLASLIEDGMKIYIPTHNEVEEENKMEATENENINKTNLKVNINTASQADLESLPGIGSATALKIINYRKENGKFKTIDDLKNVKGIGENKFEKIKDLIDIKN